MKQVNLKVEKREGTGRGACRRLRAVGQIPAVVYGKSGVRNLAVSESNLRSLMRDIHGTAALITLEDGEQKTSSVLQDLHRDPLTDTFLHVDLHEVAMDEEMSISLPVHIIGESIGVKNENGTIELHLHEVDVRCLPTKMPSYIEVDVSELHAGDSIHLSHLKPLEGVTYTGDPENVVVACTAPDAAPEDASEEASAEPASA